MEIFTVDASRFDPLPAANATAVPTRTTATTEPIAKSVFTRISYSLPQLDVVELTTTFVNSLERNPCPERANARTLSLEK
ncbi:MAG TPA: hypothetical protein VLV46_10015 [Gaiellaceae bacterium]|nr:hypothetical protein [Gaiellaceae bacterium]